MIDHVTGVHVVVGPGSRLQSPPASRSMQAERTGEYLSRQEESVDNVLL
ncbi:MAG: hypothetical protein R2844_19850 [Caldilineales bacterium]